MPSTVRANSVQSRCTKPDIIMQLLAHMGLHLNVWLAFGVVCSIIKDSSIISSYENTNRYVIRMKDNHTPNSPPSGRACQRTAASTPGSAPTGRRTRSARTRPVCRALTHPAMPCQPSAAATRDTMRSPWRRTATSRRAQRARRADCRPACAAC